MDRKMKTDRNESRCDSFRTRAIDRTGVRYGRLTAIEPTKKRQGGIIIWRCRCDCGNEILASAKNLVTGNVRSCSCLRLEGLAKLATDRRGKRYGKLVALEPLEERKGGGVLWLCRCDCGNVVKVRGNFLSTGQCWCCGKCLPRKKQ